MLQTSSLHKLIRQNVNVLAGNDFAVTRVRRALSFIDKCWIPVSGHAQFYVEQIGLQPLAHAADQLCLDV